MSDAQVPAGWYADPSGDATRLRYWDGTQWTDQYQSAPVQPGAYTPPPANYAQPVYTQPTYTQPVYGTVPIVKELSGGAKFGMFALGFFVGPIGILIAWLINKDTSASGDAIKFSVIGLAVSFVFWCLCYVLIMVLATASY
jgi:hypothetical protein